MSDYFDHLLIVFMTMIITVIIVIIIIVVVVDVDVVVSSIINRSIIVVIKRIGPMRNRNPLSDLEETLQDDRYPGDRHLVNVR